MESMTFFCWNEKYITINVGEFKKENKMGCGDILW